RTRTGDAVGERGFAGVGKTHQADVGDGFQHEAIHAVFAFLAGSGAARRAVERRLEVRVAPAAAAALAQYDLLIVFEHLGHDLTGGRIGADSAGRHTQHGRLAFAAIAVLAHAVLAALGLPVRLVFVVDEIV